MKFGRPAWAAIPLRLVIGLVLIVSGYEKLTHISNTVAFFAKYGFPIPVATAWLIGGLEFFGGVALILGLFVRFLGLIYAIEFIVALLWVQLPTSGFGPSRLVLMLIASGLALSVLGAGPISVDSHWIERK